MNSVLIFSFGLVFAVYGQEIPSRSELLSEAIKYSSEERIIRGTEVTNHSRPWMVSVSSPKVYNCGGALIYPQWVVTAAHCVIEVNEPHKVAAGTNQICETVNNSTYTKFEEKYEERNVTTIYIRSYYDVTNQNDIALLKLDRPFTVNDYIKTIPFASREYSPGEKLEISGWGDTYLGAKEYTCWLRTIEMPVVSKQECLNTYQNVFDSQLCAGYRDIKKGVCDGDSGGPLVDLNGESATLVGILSLSTEDCDDYHVFEKMTSHSSWIEETIKTASGI